MWPLRTVVVIGLGKYLIYNYCGVPRLQAAVQEMSPASTDRESGGNQAHCCH